MSRTLKGEIPRFDFRSTGNELASLLKLAPIGVIVSNGLFRETMRCEQDDRLRRFIEFFEALTDSSGQGGKQRLLIMPALNHSERDRSSCSRQASPDSIGVPSDAQLGVVWSERESNDTCSAVAHDFLYNILDERVPVLHSNVHLRVKSIRLEFCL